MLLRRVQLSNVGLYGGDHTLAFSVDKARPVTLIGGRNGAGKTTLLNAVPLALYGNRAKGLIGASAYSEHLNRLVHVGATSASISLEFDRREEGRSCRYMIERQWSRGANGKTTEALFVNVDDKPRGDLEANWPEFVEGVMPLAVSNLTLFDGERIEALADVTNSADVMRTSLYGLLGLDLVQRLHRDLGEYRRRAARAVLPNQTLLASSLLEAEDQLGVAIDELDALQGDMRSAERALEAAKSELLIANDALESVGGNRAEVRERLRAELAAAESDGQSATRRLEALVAGDLPLLLLRPLLGDVIGMGERSQESSEAHLLLVRMKERDQRLTATVEGDQSRFPSEAAAAFVELLDTDRQIYEVNHSGGFDVRDDAMSAARLLAGEYGGDLGQEAMGLVAAINEAAVVVALTRQTLESVPAGDRFEEIMRAVAEAEERVRGADREVGRARERVADGERRVIGAQREVDRLASEVLDAGLGDADAARIRREVDRAEATLTKFSARIVERHIQRITQNITRSLRCLMRKEGLISRLEIDPSTLEISLFGRSRQRLDPALLSAGERQMLATAVLWGMSRSTGRTLPTMIDTPVGRLDRSHRMNLVTRYFPAASRQVVLLSTDEEIVGEYLDHLDPYIGKSYILEYDDTADSTSIREGYFA